MRLIVPLQGVVQGRGGLILGSLIPCALYYFLQFYLKRHRSDKPPSNPPSPSQSSSNLDELQSTSSRSNLSSRGSIDQVGVSSRVSSIAKPSDSPYYIGLEKAAKDPYDHLVNPNGVINLGLAENKLCFDLIEKWVFENFTDSLIGSDGGNLDISGMAAYQPYDGLKRLKVV